MLTFTFVFTSKCNATHQRLLAALEHSGLRGEQLEEQTLRELHEAVVLVVGQVLR